MLSLILIDVRHYLNTQIIVERIICYSLKPMLQKISFCSYVSQPKERQIKQSNATMCYKVELFHGNPRCDQHMHQRTLCVCVCVYVFGEGEWVHTLRNNFYQKLYVRPVPAFRSDVCVRACVVLCFTHTHTHRHANTHHKLCDVIGPRPVRSVISTHVAAFRYARVVFVRIAQFFVFMCVCWLAHLCERFEAMWQQ